MASIHAYVLEHLEAHKGAWPAVAAGSGVPYGTLKKIATHVVRRPRIDTLEKLAAYFRSQAEPLPAPSERPAA